MGIFRKCQHGESDVIGTGSTNRRSGLWIHLNQSCGCEDMRGRDQGPICKYGFTSGSLAAKAEDVFWKIRFRAVKAYSRAMKGEIHFR